VLHCKKTLSISKDTLNQKDALNSDVTKLSVSAVVPSLSHHFGKDRVLNKHWRKSSKVSFMCILFGKFSAYSVVIASVIEQ